MTKKELKKFKKLIQNYGSNNIIQTLNLDKTQKDSYLKNYKEYKLRQKKNLTISLLSAFLLSCGFGVISFISKLYVFTSLGLIFASFISSFFICEYFCNKINKEDNITSKNLTEGYISYLEEKFGKDKLLDDLKEYVISEYVKLVKNDENNKSNFQSTYIQSFINKNDIILNESGLYKKVESFSFSFEDIVLMKNLENSKKHKTKAKTKNIIKSEDNIQ